MIHFHKKNYNIGLDIDDVLADFRKGYFDFMKKEYPNHFYFSYSTVENLSKLDEEFWLNLKPKTNGATLPFLPKCYISSRINLSENITEKWIEKNGFPCVPVIHVKTSKLEACKANNINVFVDDFIKNFEELNAANVDTLLLDCPHNKQYNVNPYRIYDLHDLPSKLNELKLL